MWKKHLLNRNFWFYSFSLVVFIACKFDNSCELAFHGQFDDFKGCNTIFVGFCSICFTIDVYKKILKSHHIKIIKYIKNNFPRAFEN